MSRFLTKITSENNIPEGDCRYLAKELLSRDMLSHVPDLKKSDIFSLGITMYELLTLTDLEKNGSEWLSFRNGTFKYPDIVETIYSKELLNAIRVMLSERTDDRPCADELLHQVFKSQEDRQIDQLEQENQQLKFNQQ
jgi:serine/threonine protein kinase